MRNPQFYPVNPPSEATGVSKSAQVVFTFREAMNTKSDATLFIFSNQGVIPPVSPPTVLWNPARTVATISPAPG